MCRQVSLIAGFLFYKFFIVSKLDVDKSYYSKVERGLTNPTLLYLKHVSEILDVNLSDLVDSSISL